MRARILIGAAAVAAVALAGCGEKKDSGSPVSAGGPQQQQQDKPGDKPADKSDKASGGLAKSAEAGKKAGTAKIATSIEAEVAGKKMTVAQGEGAVDFANKKYKFSTKMVNPATGEASGGMNVILDGGFGYLQYLMGPEQDMWMKMDMTAMVGDKAIQDMSQYFTLMAGVTEQSELGKETVHGVQTTHYKVKVDSKKILDQYPEAKAFVESMKQLANSVAPGTGNAADSDKLDEYEVWVDKDGLIYRIVQLFDTVGDGGEKVTGRSTTEFFDYGQKVEINPPPADKIKTGS